MVEIVGPDPGRRLSESEIVERFNVDHVSTFVLIKKRGSRVVHYAELVGPTAKIIRTLCGVKADPLDVQHESGRRLRASCERCIPTFRERSSIRR